MPERQCLDEVQNVLQTPFPIIRYHLRSPFEYQISVIMGLKYIGDQM
jgi:hypothetical protein